LEPENRTAASKNTNEETHFRLPATAGIRIFSGMPPSLYVVFSCVAPGANQLSVDELHRRLEWREKTRTAFPNSGEYIVAAPADKADRDQSSMPACMLSRPHANSTVAG